MTVFKGHMKIIGQNKMLILLYVAIFFGCTILFQSTAGKTETSYQAEKLNIGIVDEDGGSLAESLTEYLGNLHHLIPIENDVSEIQEKLYYREVDYVVRIPKNFYKKCIEGDEKLSVTKIPDTYSGSYVDQQINSFLNNARTYQASGFTEAESARKKYRRCSVCILFSIYAVFIFGIVWVCDGKYSDCFSESEFEKKDGGIPCFWKKTEFGRNFVHEP
jgi:ABC-2 type transport system permease protein